jgi:hypothetical protein
MSADVPPLPAAAAAAACPYAPPESGCAAGSFCTAPSDADLIRSSHHCFNCEGRIHCELFCGMKIEDFRRVVKEPIKKELLSRQLYIKWVQEIEIVQALLKGLQDESIEPI